LVPGDRATTSTAFWAYGQGSPDEQDHSIVSFVRRQPPSPLCIITPHENKQHKQQHSTATTMGGKIVLLVQVIRYDTLEEVVAGSTSMASFHGKVSSTTACAPSIRAMLDDTVYVAIIK